MKLTLRILPETYSVCRLAPGTYLEMPRKQAGLWSLTQTPDELSLVTQRGSEPSQALAIESSWRCLQVLGPLDFALVGVLASLSTVLADAEISLYAISTYDTDYLLVKESCLPRAIAAIEGQGHTVND